jgi:quercetin dioxygenase-like cupin family protein
MNNPKIRRVVTGHDEQGKAIVKIDEVLTKFN